MCKSKDLENIHNGAMCRSYRWSQSHCDIEIRVNLTETVKYENINLSISTEFIRLELLCPKQTIGKGNLNIPDGNVQTKTLMQGVFEHRIKTDSVYWLLDNEEPCIVIYVDKVEPMWWKNLLVDEEVTESGPKHYVVPVDHLDDGSRMIIDKLVAEQRNKVPTERANFHI